MSRTVPIVNVNLLDIPRAGRTQFIIRTHYDDRAMINAAAAAIGMKQTEFARTLVVQGARAIMDGVEPDHIPPPLINPGNQEMKDGEPVVVAQPLQEQEVRIAVNNIMSSWGIDWTRGGIDRTDAVDAVVEAVMKVHNG